jgi:23S rRNA (guanosine2251-2'-O)-methyltransferase
MGRRGAPPPGDHAGGFHAVEAALQGGRVRRLLVAEGRGDGRLRKLLELAAERGVDVARRPRRELDALVSSRHQGVVAELDGAGGSGGEAAFRDEGALEEILDACDGPPLLLVLEGLTDPRNLGACLRSADGAGVDAVVVPRSRTAPLNAAARNVASGAAETVPVIAVANLARTLDWLRQRGLALVGLAGEGEVAPWETDLAGPVAVLMGSEDKGLRRLSREACDVLVRLPMQGQVESLNVSVAAGIALYEVVRQRA